MSLLRIFKRHDTTPARARILDAAGIPEDLTLASGTYTLSNVDTGVLKVNRGVITVRDQTLYPGEVYYPYQSADVNTAGIYVEEWEILYADGTKQTFPAGEVITVRIEADADNT